MNYTVSVVVPVYKVEQFLDKCVESILTQTFPDFELILVDDGSPDRCPQMCDIWAERDSRVRVFHQENKGLPGAVRRGIQEAIGQYITFVDSDDWVDPCYIQTLFEGIVESSADVAQCNFQKEFANEVTVFKYPPKVFDEQEIRSDLLFEMANDRIDGLSNARVTKMYKTELVRRTMELCDPSISMGEDFLFNFAVFGRCKRIVVLDTLPLYHYVHNAASISGTYDSAWKYGKRVYMENVKRIAEEYGCYCENNDFLLQRGYAGYIYICAITAMSRKEKKKEIKDIIAMLERKSWKAMIKDFEVPAERICLYLCYWGQIDLMLILVDIVKKIKGIA